LGAGGKGDSTIFWCRSLIYPDHSTLYHSNRTRRVDHHITFSYTQYRCKGARISTNNKLSLCVLETIVSYSLNTLWIYVCIYASMFVCDCTYVYVRMHIYTRVRVLIYVSTSGLENQDYGHKGSAAYIRVCVHAYIYLHPV
jgi:hypothetical protein